MYILRMFDKTEFELSEVEAMSVAESMNAGREKCVVIQGNIIVLSGISAILKAEKAQENRREIDRDKQMVGVTPDGELVEKRFGVWYYQRSHNDYAYDDEGKCIMRYEGHPILPTVTEYEESFKQLPPSEWLPALLGQSEAGTYRGIENRIASELTKI